jgi:hypothetical protein
MSLRDELIRFYAAWPVSDILSAAEFQHFARQYENDATFQRERHTVEMAKAALERVMAGAGSFADEVRAALGLLHRCRLDGKAMESACYDLAVAAYKPRWSTAQQQYFEEAYKEIRCEYDFFFSFTSRHQNEPGENPINTDYKYFIQQVLPGVWEVADRKRANLMAQAVRALLLKALPRGFFYPHSAGDNRVVKEKLEAACASSRVFVQMVQNVMFWQPPPADENWCFFEYQYMKATTAGDPDRIVFLVAENDRNALTPESAVPLTFGNWHKEAKERDVEYLPIVRNYNGRKIEALRKLITEKVQPRLLRAWDRILERVPEK